MTSNKTFTILVLWVPTSEVWVNTLFHPFIKNSAYPTAYPQTQAVDYVYISPLQKSKNGKNITS